MLILHLFVKVSQPGENLVTLILVFKSSYYPLLYYLSNHAR